MTAVTTCEMLDYYVRINGDKLALKQSDRTFTYAEWEQQATRLAQTLSSRGLGRGDRIAVLTFNCLEQFIILYATMKLGAVYVPINYRLAPQEITYILQQSEAKAVFSEGNELCEKINSLSDSLSLDTFIRVDSTHPINSNESKNDCWQALDKLIADAPVGNIDFEPQPETIVYQMYTSGTTGFPKGVMVSQQQLANFVMSMILIPPRIDVGKLHLIVAPLFHAAALCNGIVALCMGRPVLVLKDFEPQQLVDTLVSEKISEVMLVPAMIQSVLQTVKNLDQYNFSHLEKIFYGASSMTVDVLRRAMDGFQCQFQQGFGMTESVASTTILTVEDHQKALNGRPELLRSCGRAAAFAALKIVDPDSRKELAIGEVGEIAVRSPFLMDGYSKQPEKTNEVFVDGWYYSGDGGYMDAEGYVFIKDRLKDMIISGGENVYPAEVENTLMSHPDIIDVAVIGLPDEKYGETVVAICVGKNAARPDDKAMIEYCRDLLAGYKIPRRYEYIDELPRNASGKLLKVKLRERFAGAVTE